jgi:hypothetical protein
MMKIRRDMVIAVAVFAALMGYVIASEIHYARSISPKGVSTVMDFIQRFGEPRRVRMVTHEGRSYYEFTGGLPSRFVLATPSAPPAYVFDDQGRFVTWCSDPGDTPGYRSHWSLQGTNQVELSRVREKFGLQ